MRKSAVRSSLLLAACAAAVDASSYVAVSDEALADQTPVVVVGRVLSVNPAAGVAAGTPRTEFEIEVVEALKGDAAGLIRVRVPGGEAGGGRALRIHGAPRLRAGERALLFLTPREDFFTIRHLALGAFHEVEVGGRRLATRRLESARELRMAAGQAAPPVGAQPLRDFDAFAAWVRARAGGEAAPEYRLAEQPALRSAVDAFTLFEDEDSQNNLRWFVFDTGGNVSWRALSTPQGGLAGGGYSEFQTGLLAWNAEAQTPVDYRYNSNTTGSTNGLDNYDTLNTIVFNDPTDILEPFNCVSGGFLALGGPWYDGGATRIFKGIQFHEILNADIVINSGIGCFFADSPNASKAAQELFGHELGHTLGIGHSCGDDDGPACGNAAFDDALMRAFVHDDGRGARLGTDDVAALRFLYTAAPAAPSNLAATAVSTTEIALTWNDNSTNENSFRIERKLLGGSYVEVASAPANATGATVGGLTPETAYTFRVRARNANGDSAYSNEATAATQAVPGPCVADAQTVCLSGGRFRVRALWRASGGAQALANVAPAGSDNSGIFYFVDPSNWELLLKVLNACGFATPRYWVFYAATTNVELVITVADTANGTVKVYFNPLNTPAPPVLDTNAFATCP